MKDVALGFSDPPGRPLSAQPQAIGEVSAPVAGLDAASAARIARVHVHPGADLGLDQRQVSSTAGKSPTPSAVAVGGGAGADLIKVRAGRIDVVSCGSGNDSVRAGANDIIAKDCEKVTN